MMNQQNIPCPDCQTPIYFDPRMLLQGAKFSCPNCHATLSLAAESKAIVEQSLDKLDTLKSQLLNKKTSE